MRSAFKIAVRAFNYAEFNGGGLGEDVELRGNNKKSMTAKFPSDEADSYSATYRSLN